jgi:CheY-like chemotaxis protein
MNIKPAKVLLVDDSEDDTILVQLVFKKLGMEHDLLTLSGGDQAISYLRGNPPYSDRKKYPIPAIMLLDLRMPGIDGLEVLHWVRTQSAVKALPVILFTGSESPQHILDCCRLGANSFIQKPGDVEGLCASLRSVTDFWLNCCRLPEVAA